MIFYVFYWSCRYDSVTINGHLWWQNELNEYNKPFFDISDGIFTNYSWQVLLNYAPSILLFGQLFYLLSGHYYYQYNVGRLSMAICCCCWWSKVWCVYGDWCIWKEHIWWWNVECMWSVSYTHFYLIATSYVLLYCF